MRIGVKWKVILCGIGLAIGVTKGYYRYVAGTDATQADRTGVYVGKVPKRALPSVKVQKELTGVVTRVSDGDTIWVTPNGGVKTKIRLDRIDAPESKQPYGDAATAALKALIAGKTVKVTYTTTDRYGRVLGIVWLDDTDINLKMVQEGHAWHGKMQRQNANQAVLHIRLECATIPPIRRDVSFVAVRGVGDG